MPARIQFASVIVIAAIVAGCAAPANNSSPTSNGQAQQDATPSVSINGVSFTELLTHIDATGKDLLMILVSNSMGAREPGDMLAIPEVCTLTWKDSSGQSYTIKGQAYVAIRNDSPNRYDFALVPSDGQALPAGATSRKTQQLSMNADSTFVAGKGSKISSNAAWICKLGASTHRTVNDPMVLLDW